MTAGVVATDAGEATGAVVAEDDVVEATVPAVSVECAGVATDAVAVAEDVVEATVPVAVAEDVVEATVPAVILSFISSIVPYSFRVVLSSHAWHSAHATTWRSAEATALLVVAIIFR